MTTKECAKVVCDDVASQIAGEFGVVEYGTMDEIGDQIMPCVDSNVYPMAKEIPKCDYIVLIEAYAVDIDEALEILKNSLSSKNEMCSMVEYGVTSCIVGHGHVVPFVFAAFTDGISTSSERAHAAYLIGESGSAEKWQELERFSHDSSASTRRLVASAFGKLYKKLGRAHDGAISALCRLAFEDDAPQVNQYALKALINYKFDTPAILERLNVIVNNVAKKSYVREAASELLGKKLPGSIYRENLDREMTLTFENALNVSWKIVHGMSKDCQDDVYASLDRGKAILVSENQCAGYMAWFAKKHMAKFAAAFSLLPKEICDNVIDLYDWGCGVGLASFAFRDWYDRMFPDRKYRKKVRMVTLIEPSNIALEWATYNARRCFPEAKVIPAQKRFSELTQRDFETANNPTQCRVHIFSNVLDMRTINGISSVNELAKVAKNNSLGWDDVVVLISPDYGDVDRTFDLFVSSLIDGTDYVVEHLLETKRFVWSKDSGDSVNAKGVLSVWRIQSPERHRDNGRLSCKWRNVYDQLLLDESAGSGVGKLVNALHEKLKSIPDEEIGFRYRPNLYGTTPDMVVFRTGYLPLLVSLGNEVRPECNMAVGPNESFMMPIETVRRELCKNNKTLFGINTSFGLVTALAYSAAGDSFCGYKESYKGIDGKTHAVYEWKSQIPWRAVRTDDGRNVRNAVKELLLTRKANEKKKEIIWDAKQKRLTMSRQGSQKIAGCFGSGKTTVLVERAINAFRRTHRPVLILTYNVSLRNHIESALASRMDASWSNRDFIILNIHQFIRTHGLPFVSESENNVMTFLSNGATALRKLLEVRKTVEKYRTILVDECQDYEYSWLEILKRVYLSDNGEYVLFGDEKQNVYGRQLDGMQIRTNVPGNWNILDKCHRSMGRLLDFILAFQQLMPKYEQDVIERIFALDDSTIRYVNLNGQNSMLAANVMMDRMHELRVSPGDVAVLAETHAFLRDMESEYRKRTGGRTEMMVWTAEQLADLEFCKNRDERDLKLFFDGDQTERIKFSTIESFKGFESRCVFLFINATSQNSDWDLERIYAGITRAIQHLEIINLGNAKVDELLSKVIINSERRVI